MISGKLACKNIGKICTRFRSCENISLENTTRILQENKQAFLMKILQEFLCKILLNFSENVKRFLPKKAKKKSQPNEPITYVL